MVPSVNVPVAVNCSVVPSGIVVVGGSIAIDASSAAVTISVVELAIESEVALIIAVPIPLLVHFPV